MTTVFWGKAVQGKQSVRGFSMIEILVALLVLGIGIMGFAALQLKSVHLTEETYSRSQAMSIAQDFVERARANFSPKARERYLQAGQWTGDIPDDAPSCVLTERKPTKQDSCTEVDMASSDIAATRTHAGSVLQNGNVGFEECGNLYCVTVAWAETSVESCDQGSFADGSRGAEAHCVTLEFIP